jgi:hypothetical protein
MVPPTTFTISDRINMVPPQASSKLTVFSPIHPAISSQPSFLLSVDSMWTSLSHRQPFQNQGLMASRGWMIKCIIAQFVFTGKQRNVPTQPRRLLLKN